MTSHSSGMLNEVAHAEFGGPPEPWPNDVELFQPFEVEQILLPDNAVCLSIQAFLHMCKLDFRVEMRANAEHMSPSGRLPFIKAGKFVIAEMDPIVSFVNSKGISLTDHLDASQKADMRAYMSLVSNVLGNAEIYISWVNKETYENVTWPRYGSVYPWPLNYILNYQKKSQANKKLSALGWGKRTLQDVYNEVDNCCQALSERLDNQQYFFNNKPTELDALVFGHLFAILTTPMPDGQKMAGIIKRHKNLVDLCQNVDKEYFDRVVGSSGTSSENNFEKL